MQNKNLNDFIIDILQDFDEIQSTMKVLKGSINNDNQEISMTDVENTLEIIIAKMNSTKLSINKYVDIAII